MTITDTRFEAKRIGGRIGAEIIGIDPTIEGDHYTPKAA